MAKVSFHNVSKVFGKEVKAVQDLNLEIKDGEFMVLVGPSGCGKTTALRMVAGLEELSNGQISIDERLVNDVPPKDRDVAMVFQNYALYPHMTVYENMAFGLKIRELKSVFWQLSHWSQASKVRQDIDRRIREVSQMLDIESLLQRRPKELSGGQKQRVALGRAIVRKPRVFLMDEPLSNLDAKLRTQTRAELIRLHRKLGTTTIYVTHDQHEAMTMGHRIAVMKDGLLQQCGTPEEVYHRPTNRFVAGFIGSPPMNLVKIRITGSASEPIADAGDFQLLLPPDHPAASRIGKDVELGVRPESILVGLGGNEDAIGFRAKVDVIEPLGSHNIVYLLAGSTSWIAMLDSVDLLQVGQDAEFSINKQAIHFFDLESGIALR